MADLHFAAHDMSTCSDWESGSTLTFRFPRPQQPEPNEVPMPFKLKATWSRI